MPKQKKERIYVNIEVIIEALKEKKILTEVNVHSDLSFDGISYNSKEAKEKDLFICKGANFNVSYLEDSIKSGIALYVSEKQYQVDTPSIIVSDIRLAMGIICQHFYDFTGLELIGITGTKGKTTTTHLIGHILDCPFTSTLSVKEDDEEKPANGLTTPETVDFYNIIDKAKKSNHKTMCLEVSSQAIKYHRSYGLEYEVACFLNMSNDHISEFEHPDYEDYFKTKLKIIDSTKVLCVNLDFEEAKEVIDTAKAKGKKVYTFSCSDKSADFRIDNITHQNGTEFVLHTPTWSIECTTKLLGDFNLQNILAAVAVAWVREVPKEVIQKKVSDFQIPGRVNLFPTKDNKLIYMVDFAHNATSYKLIFDLVNKTYPDRKVYSVFGCRGNRAKNRRKELIEIACEHSDGIIIVPRDPGSEGFKKIAIEMQQNLPENFHNYYVSSDIHTAIKLSHIIRDKEKSIVLLLITPRESDYEIVKELVRAYDHETSM